MQKQPVVSVTFSNPAPGRSGVDFTPGHNILCLFKRQAVHTFNRANVENFWKLSAKNAGFTDFLSFSVHLPDASGGKGAVDRQVEC